MEKGIVRRRKKIARNRVAGPEPVDPVFFSIRIRNSGSSYEFLKTFGSPGGRVSYIHGHEPFYTPSTQPRKKIQLTAILGLCLYDLRGGGGKLKKYPDNRYVCPGPSIELDSFDLIGISFLYHDADLRCNSVDCKQAYFFSEKGM